MDKVQLTIAAFGVRLLALASIPLIFAYYISTSSTAHIPHITQVTGKSFQSEIMEAKTPVVVVYSAKWCPACSAYKPFIEDASKKYNAVVKFVTIDVDEEVQLSEKIDVIPTTVIYNKGLVTTDHIGAILDTDRLNKFIDEAIKK